MTKLRLITALIIFALGFSAARAADSITMDGNWWTGLSDTQKLGVAQGLVSGYESGYMSGVFAQQNKEERFFKITSKLTPAEKQVVIAGLSRAAVPLDSFPSFTKTFGTYIHGIDDFFENHSDRMTVLPAYMIDCLADDPDRSCDTVGGN